MPAKENRFDCSISSTDSVRLHLTIGLCVLLQACTFDDWPLPTTGAGHSEHMLKLHNSARQYGLTCQGRHYPPVPALKWNSTLARAAALHGEYLESQLRLTHSGPGGSNAGERIEYQGYLWQTYGENLAFGFDTADQVFAMWSDSTEHCRNIMNGAFQEMGSAEAGGFWVVVMARPKHTD